MLGWPGDDTVSYSKCGRTDKGVSAFGQVIGLSVRSNRPLPKPTAAASPALTPPIGDTVLDDGFGTHLQDLSDDDSDPEFDDAKDELIYPQILNRLLPPDIRVLAWCPKTPPGFSARFFCEERRYRYFFTNPPMAPGTAKDGTEMLDIDAMRTAAKLFVGNHDFRNFCKLDASKQISRFDRVIKHADIKTVDPLPPTFSAPSPSAPPSPIPSSSSSSNSCPKIYYLELHGSAFLWHQVRHMVAILFLIGQGLESPSLVSTLLDTTTNPCKPTYEMANDRPLVLWDCIYPANTLSWIYAGTAWKDGRDDLVDSVWSLWHRARIDELLTAGLLGLIAKSAPSSLPTHTRSPVSQPVVVGSCAPVYRGRYVPVLDRLRMEPVEVINTRYVEKRGDWAENRNKRVEARKAKTSVKEEEEERRGGGAGVYVIE